MKDILVSFFKYFLYVGIIIVLAAIIFFFLTRKYSKKQATLYGFFFSNTSRENMIISLSITSFLFTILFLIYPESMYSIKYYAYFFLIMLMLVIAHKPKLVIFDIITTIINVFMLSIYKIALDYANRISDDKYVNILLVLFLILIGIYSLYTCFKKIEILLNYRNKRKKDKDETR